MLLQVLLVCTGNICRSPIAHGLLVDRLTRMGGDVMEVRSAGTWGRSGYPATTEAVEAAAELGVDIDAHRSSRFTADLASWADLILTMTTEQAEDIAELAPDAGVKTFTLKELVALLGSLPSAAVGPPTRKACIQRIAQADRARSAEYGPPADPDVADPLGLSSEVYRAVASELEGLVGALLRGLLGGRESAAAGS